MSCSSLIIMKLNYWLTLENFNICLEISQFMFGNNVNENCAALHLSSMPLILYFILCEILLSK
jgi:hypothetical protein